MPQVTIEYMIMVPVLIMQIILFPYLAITIRNTWVESYVNLELQEITGHLGSSIQQLYYTMNHASISNGSLTIKLDTPTTIDDSIGHHYAYTITLRNATNPNTSAKVMNITLNLKGASGETSTIVTLGENAAWQDNSTFPSNSTSIIATKTPGSIWLSFEGGA